MRSRSRGFSLVEIVIAIGIVAFALVAILGMFPMAMKSARESREETHAAVIAQFIIGQIRAQSTNRPGLPTGLDPTSTNSIFVPPDFKTSPTAWMQFNRDGEPSGRASAQQFDDPNLIPAAQKTNCAYIARLKVERDQPSTNVFRLTVEVVAGLAPHPYRQTNSFVTCIRNPEA